MYTSDDGQTRLQLRVEPETIWLSQLEIAELFQTSKQNVSLHAKNYRTKLYNLDLILAIGYRVRSPRGVQFRQWASTHLKEFLRKGFVMDDERLKNPGAWDYFDELLARIRDIRASEKRFYQKVRDLFSLSADYQARERETALFFAEAQNKLLYATTAHTAAELISKRADPNQPNMALTSWQGSRVRKQAVIIAKNYLKKIARERYEAFDQQPRIAEAKAADAEDLKEIEQLERALKTQSFQRLLSSQKKHPVKASKKGDDTLLEFIKDPYVLEFLQLPESGQLKENKLEQAIIDELQKFLLELGKGFSFVARQMRISTETSHFYLDLVFYNYLLKCFVIIDLKSGKLSHQDIGQMDMYVRMFDDLKRGEDDNPTIGIILCDSKDETIVKYSVIKENQQLFASKYQRILPTEAELIAEIEREKRLIGGEE